MELAKGLKHHRLQLGYKSARSFFNGHLLKRIPLDINYSYYAKIEKGEVTPSAPLVQSLASVFDEATANQLILAHCRDLFPKKKFLFESPAEGAVPATSHSKPEKVPGQTLLTPRQVATIVADRNHYYFYLVTVLARWPIATEDLSRILGGVALAAVAKNFEKARLSSLEGNLVRSLSTEMRFPKPTTPLLKDAYRKMDRWDREFAAHFQMEPLVDKTLIRRTSSRHFAVLLGMIENLTDLVRISDEARVDLNQEVLLFQVGLSRGKIPG